MVEHSPKILASEEKAITNHCWDSLSEEQMIGTITITEQGHQLTSAGPHVH